eukprot:416368-Lingulodinium_polyedra.AAC.1
MNVGAKVDLQTAPFAQRATPNHNAGVLRAGCSFAHFGGNAVGASYLHRHRCVALLPRAFPHFFAPGIL